MRHSGLGHGCSPLGTGPSVVHNFKCQMIQFQKRICIVTMVFLRPCIGRLITPLHSIRIHCVEEEMFGAVQVELFCVDMHVVLSSLLMNAAMYLNWSTRHSNDLSQDFFGWCHCSLSLAIWLRGLRGICYVTKSPVFGKLPGSKLSTIVWHTSFCNAMLWKKWPLSWWKHSR